MSEALKNGVHRCPHCGSSDVSLGAADGKLQCNYCRTVFEGKKDNAAGGVEGLKGEVRGEGADDIIPGDDIVVTFKCPSCGAEVVVNTDESLSASCHWCKHVFSVNEKMKNGAVPDLVLPFKISKSKAQEKARECIEKTSNVNADFKSAFEKDGVRGVYFPYLIVDVNARMTMHGRAEKTTSETSRLPATVDEYEIDREFSVFVDDLTVESSAARLNQDTMVNSNNIINAILPFDTENAEAWDANYLRGFASERRNVDINSLKEIVALQSGDIARAKARELTKEYDRGVRWEKEHLGIKGTKWKAAYLPVWLFSYRHEGEGRIYYIAINARTGETVGQVLCGSSSVGQKTTVVSDYYSSDKVAQHHHEKETSAKVEDVKSSDVKTRTGVKSFSSEIVGRNDKRVIGSLSTGRDNMLSAEKARFANGANYTSRPTHSSSGGSGMVAIIIFVIIIVLILLLGGGSGGGSSSDYDYDWGSSSSYDSDWGSSYDSDWGSSFDSGGDYGFDYSYDY